MRWHLTVSLLSQQSSKRRLGMLCQAAAHPLRDAAPSSVGLLRDHYCRRLPKSPMTVSGDAHLRLKVVRCGDFGWDGGPDALPES
jgi:hypothetical protein